MERLDFDKIAEQFEQLSTGAQATMLFRLVKKAGPAVLRSNIRYSFQSLDKINASLPEGHPYKERYKLWKTSKGNSVYVDEPRPWRGQFNHDDREDKTHHQPAEQ